MKIGDVEMKMKMNTGNEELLSYFNSSDIDVSLGRELIENLINQGLLLDNKQKNIIIKNVQSIYNKGIISGQKRVAHIITSEINIENDKISENLMQVIDRYK